MYIFAPYPSSSYGTRSWVWRPNFPWWSGYCNQPLLCSSQPFTRTLWKLSSTQKKVFATSRSLSLSRWHFKVSSLLLSHRRSLHLLCQTCRIITDNTGYSMQFSIPFPLSGDTANDHCHSHIIAVLNERTELLRLKALWISRGTGDKKPDQGY